MRFSLELFAQAELLALLHLPLFLELLAQAELIALASTFH